MTQILTDLHLLGLVIGLATFIIIGLFHPLVIKGEYYFGTGCWWVFAICGVVLGVASYLVDDVLWSSLLAVTAFSSFWSILEVFEQRKRVERGWFPANPKRKSRK